jgi:hypothetical protein
MRLNIHGIGTLSLGLDEPFVQGTGSLQTIPIGDYAKPGLRRKFGRLATMFYVAASRAIENARIEDLDGLAIVTSTALGEATVSLNIVAQIHESRGKVLSPRLVPNSVHNSPAGHLTIGKRNHCPSVTVSQGWLSAEAGLMAAEDLFHAGLAEKALVVFGDEADTSWPGRLEELGATQWARSVASESFQEGAVALVVGREPGGLGLGTVSAGVERIGSPRNDMVSVLEKNKIKLGLGAEIRVRSSAGGVDVLKGIGNGLGIDPDRVCLDGPGLGSAQAGAFIALKQCIERTDSEELLLLGAEMDEIGFVHWMR